MDLCFVMECQAFHHCGMVECDGQQLEVVPSDLLAQERRAGRAEWPLAESRLDGDFPVTRNADELSIIGILDSPFGRGAE